jgi:hypothetical protein
MKYRLVWLLVEGTHGLSFGQEVPTKRPSPSPLLSAQIKNNFTEFFSRAVELQCDSVAHYFTILFFVLSNWTLFINVNHTFSQHAHCIQMENDSKLNYYIQKKEKKMITSFTAIKSWKILISRDPNIHDSYTKFGVHFLLQACPNQKIVVGLR